MAMIWLAVIARIVANPFSNVFQKVLAHKQAEPLFVICMTHGLLSLLCAPFCLVYLPHLSAAFWLNISVCAVLAVAGNALIVQAMKLSDLSVLGPINAYKAAVSLVPGLILLREVPSLSGMGGIALIVGGSYFLVDRSESRPGATVFGRLWGDRGVQCRLAALVLSAIEAVFLKKALLVSSPLTTFVFWAVLGLAVSLVAVCSLMSGRLKQEIGIARLNLREYLMLFLTTGVMQLCTLLTFQALQVGYALALFQTSAIISVILGYRLFQERHFLRRLGGSTVMVVGAALIIMGR
jgi:drug/metabolite transporter (DMT)-like permease